MTLARRQDPETPCLALNTYCRSFLLPQGENGVNGNGGDLLGIWCPEPGYIRLLCFAPDQLRTFPLTEVAGWFKQSPERVYSTTEPLAEVEISSSLPAGTHPLEIPAEFRALPELLVISSCPARGKQDPAAAIFLIQPDKGEVQVFPQRWFNAENYDVGRQWITRVARDPVSQRIIGEGVKIGAFELTEDGTEITRMLE